MDFTLTSDQEALQEAVRKLCEGRFPMERIRQLSDVGGVDRALWRELADAGVFSLRLPEADGGAGLGTAEAALVFEELGRALVPGPLVWTHLAAGVIAGAAEGERVVGGLARQEEPFLVEYPEAIDVLLAERSVEFAKERLQFDRPIGSFQAIKHLLADMFVRSEVARSAVYAAAVNLDEPALGPPGRAVAGAKLLAGEAATLNAKAATQVHGGMGFTWEVDVHLYLKRAWVLDTVFGTPEMHADTVAGLLGDAHHR